MFFVSFFCLFVYGADCTDGGGDFGSGDGGGGDDLGDFGGSRGD